MFDALTPNPDRAWDFLKWSMPEGYYYLERMNSEGKPSPGSKKYGLEDAGNAKRFIATNNSSDYRRNLYFLPNTEFLTGKRAKANIGAARFLHVDLDCKDYSGTEAEQQDKIIGLLLDARERPKGIPEPTAVWFTGGGYQALWRLADPIDPSIAEEFNYSLLFVLQGGPGTHNIDRLLRLPDTINWLNDTKREAGREPALSYLLEPVNFHQPAASYTLDDFTMKRRAPGSALSPAKGKPPQVESAIEPLPLPQDLSEILPSDPKWAEVIATGENPAGRIYASRSERVFASTIWMLGNGVKPGHILSILTDADLGISAHVREQSNPLAYARRQVRRASQCIAAKMRDWPAQTKEGLPAKHHPENIRHALARQGISARRNLFTFEDEIEGQGFDQRDINDIAEILCSTFHRELDFLASTKAIRRELITLAHENPYHPIIDYLDGLEWDGKERVETWLIDYCGVEDTELNREFGRKVLIAAVRRIKTPGVKFDTMLVLEGPQGTDKSSLVATLAVTDTWFCESLNLRSDDKTKAELLARAWIVECQELDGLNKVTSQELKKFLSERADTYRKPYDKHAQQYPRHCIIIGTTNESDYLRDLTGNRRVWPVHVGKINIDGFAKAVDQLWAEAAAREADGEGITLPRHLWDEAAIVQTQRMVEDPYTDVLESIFSERHGKVSMDTIKQLLEIASPRMTPQDTRRIKAIMAGIGWDYGTHRLYDLTGRERSPRKGFASGTGETGKVEYRLKRGDNGDFYVTEVRGGHSGSSPF